MSQDQRSGRRPGKEKRPGLFCAPDDCGIGFPDGGKARRAHMVKEGVVDRLGSVDGIDGIDALDRFL